MAEIPNDRLSLVVGVTGHRDIAADDEAPLRAAFGGILDRLSVECPHTPLLVLSGLASGADSLAAEEAIARRIPIIACLPMPADEYEEDFSPGQLERFRTLLAQCSRVVVTSRTRDRGYVATGHFIAQYSQVVVAFWDGEASRGAGGTADIIEMRMTGNPKWSDIEDIPYLPDAGPVDVIATPHERGPRIEAPYEVRHLTPHGATSSSVGDMLAHIDTYNADLAQIPMPMQGSELQSFMERTDAVTNRLQRKTGHFQILLLVIALLAAAAQIITHVPPFAKVIGLIAAFVAYKIARAHDYENRYQDYRAVAEGLRVQIAWYYAGLGHRLADAAYLRMQEGELQWIRLTLRSFHLLFCEGRTDADASHDNPICRGWIESQWEYYRGASGRELGLKKRLDRITKVCVLIGTAFAVVAALALGKSLPCALFAPLCRGGNPPQFDLLQNLLTVPIVLASLVGAVCAHYAEKQSLVENAHRYERMFKVFDRARRDLVAVKGDQHDSMQVIYQLGRAALIEHAEWLIMRRERPMEVVTM